MTIVEVVIAMIVLMVVATAVGMATVDGSKQRGTARMDPAERAFERTAFHRDAAERHGWTHI